MVANIDKIQIKRLYDGLRDWTDASFEAQYDLPGLLRLIGGQLEIYSHILKREEHPGKTILYAYGPFKFFQESDNKLYAKPFGSAEAFGYIISEEHIGRRLLTLESWPSLDGGDIVLSDLFIEDIRKFCEAKGE